MKIGKGIALASFCVCAVWSAIAFQNERFVAFLFIPALVMILDF